MGIFDDAKHEFILQNGASVKSLPELSFSLKIAEESVFNHHVTGQRNDFADWIANSIGDHVLRNKIENVKSKRQMIDLIDDRLFELSAADAVSEEMPPDIPPNVDVPLQVAPQNNSAESNINYKAAVINNSKDSTNKIVLDIPKDERYKNPQINEAKKGDVSLLTENLKKEPEQHAESIVEIREIQPKKLGYKNLDRLFKKGIPSICNIIFAGKMSTGKTETAMKIVLQSPKAVYISLQDTEEKIINTFYVIDNKVLDKMNSGTISIKKLDTFEMVRTQDIEHFTYIKDLSPDIVIVDSLSSLRLSFGDNQIGYRYFIDKLFKYFESLGIIAIFIKELDDEKEINKEFYENILSDIIVIFTKGGRKLNVVKYYKSR